MLGQKAKHTKRN